MQLTSHHTWYALYPLISYYLRLKIDCWLLDCAALSYKSNPCTCIIIQLKKNLTISDLDLGSQDQRISK